MVRQIALTKEAEKNLKRLPKNIIEHVKEAIKEICLNPLAGKALKGGLRGQYSFRIGDYRLVYILNKELNKIIILYIRHRKDAY